MPTPYSGSSIVDYLGSTGRASDFGSRSRLAQSSGITGYTGTAEQNTRLLNSLRGGSTQNPNGGLISSNVAPVGKWQQSQTFNPTPTGAPIAPYTPSEISPVIKAETVSNPVTPITVPTTQVTPTTGNLAQTNNSTYAGVQTDANYTAPVENPDKK